MQMSSLFQFFFGWNASFELFGPFVLVEEVFPGTNPMKELIENATSQQFLFLLVMFLVKFYCIGPRLSI